MRGLIEQLEPRQFLDAGAGAGDTGGAAIGPAEPALHAETRRPPASFVGSYEGTYHWRSRRGVTGGGTLKLQIDPVSGRAVRVLMEGDTFQFGTMFGNGTARGRRLRFEVYGIGVTTVRARCRINRDGNSIVGRYMHFVMGGRAPFGRLRLERVVDASVNPPE